MEANTAMNVNDTLNGQGGGGYTGGYSSAQAAYDAPSLPGYGAGGQGYTQQAMPGAPGFPGAMPGMPMPPKPKTILALTGQKIEDHVTRLLLEDIHFEHVPESRKGEFYDDGTHGDLVAGDNIWTNYTTINEVLSPESNYLKLVYLRMLELTEDMNPIEFFGIPVATDEPLSPLPKLSDNERDRDETFMRQWHQRFLALYRQAADDPKSDFYPIFVSSAPNKPDVPAPAAEIFFPNAFRVDGFILQTVESAVQPALEPPRNANATGSQYSQSGTSGRSGGGSSYGGGGSRRGSGGSGGSGGYSGDRWQNLRQEAQRYSQGSFGSAQSSSYFRR
jgi:uncharacterized membrane protein YgcG